jgi:hypothetical protein
METILMGLEFVSEASTYIGYVTSKLIYDCRALATIYGHWVSENLEPIGDEPDKRAIKRIDIRFMQLFDNMTRVLSTLLTLSEVEVTDEIRAHITSGMIAVENLTSVLVEITVRAIRVMEITKEKTSLTKGMGNIMSNPKTTFIYMGASLLTFADKIVELAGREWMEGGRIQVFFRFLFAITFY